MRICVIGTGPSGLAVLKELKELGFEPIAFESQANLGGVFSSSYENLLLTGSDLNITFGSFPDMDVSRPKMWKGWEYVSYLERYARHFDLIKHVRFSTKVEKVLYDRENDTWAVTTRPVDGSSEPSEDEFDRIVVCTGSNAAASWPELPGQDRFEGKILHSSEFKNEVPFRDKRVLLVGLGESGSDISLEIAKVAKATAISSRRGPGYLIPRHFGGTVSDLDTNRCYHSLPYSLGKSNLVRFKRRIESLFKSPEDDSEVLATVQKLNEKRGFPWQQRFSTKSTNFIQAILYHGALYKPGIARLEPGRVLFDDGTYFECDTIVLCTGFKPNFPFFDQDDEWLQEAQVPRRLYVRTFHPRLGEKAAWVGLVRPGVGAIPPCAEMQARYVALVFSGKKSLPSVDVMEREAHRWAQRDLAQFPIDAIRLGTLTDYFQFMHNMSELIGCNPPLLRLFLTKPGIWTKVMFGPLSPVQFRLVGPGAAPEKAEQVLREIPTMPTVVLAYEFVILLLSKALSAIGLSRFRPAGF